MATPLIKDLIQIQSGYSAQVDLGLELKNANKNRARIGRYRPIASHRKAFERVARALNVNDKRSYLITGNYGTGKSHLLLMLANYFMLSSRQTPMKEFFENYTDKDPEQADKLSAARANGRYLVALCDYESRDDFAEVVLRAVMNALREENLEDELNTPFDQAVRKLDTLEKESKDGTALVNYYEIFIQQLKERYPQFTMPKLRASLQNFDREALQTFRSLHQQILRTPFSFDAANLTDILTSTLSSPKFRENFEGIVVLFDEFGYALGDANRLSLNTLQQFAQLCQQADPGRGKLIFVGAAHKSFSAYSGPWAAADFAKVSDRIEEVSLTPEGVEEIIGAIVNPQKNSKLWKEKIATRGSLFDSFTVPMQKNKLFDNMPPPVRREKIIENIYPMHPMATHAIIRLSQEIASNNRTVFTFFSSETDDYEEGSFLSFINNTPIETNGDLNFYPVDLLTTYFEPQLVSTNVDLNPRDKDILRDYENTLRQLKRAADADPLFTDDEVTSRVMKVMLVYSLIDIPNSLDNILFGLNVPLTQRAAIENRIKDLHSRRVIYQNPSGVLEFRRSDVLDVDKLVEEFSRERGEQPLNIPYELGLLVPLAKSDKYVEAKEYNQAYNEDKRIERRFVVPQELATESILDNRSVSYFERLDWEIEQEVSKNGDYDGIALYVVCESNDDIQKARDLAARNKSLRIAVGIPNAPMPFRVNILSLKAIGDVRNAPEANNYKTQDNALLNEREATYKSGLVNLRNRVMDVRAITWHGQNGIALQTDPTKPNIVASQMMERLYTKRTKFSHDDLNKIREAKTFARKHPSLIEATKEVFTTTQEIVINREQSDSSGDIRYLQKCLFQRGVLRRSREVGDDTYCDIERDVTKFEETIPALADMIAELNALGSDNRLNLREFISKYKQPPYGLGPVALSLFFASVIRYFGDTIIIKKDNIAVGDLAVNDFEILAEIVKGEYPLAFVKHREINSAERALISKVYELFGAPLPAGQTAVAVAAAYNAIKTWYETQPPIAKVQTLYPDQTEDNVRKFLTVLETIYRTEPRGFVLDELKTICGYESDDLVTIEIADCLRDNLIKAKQAIEEGKDRVELGIMKSTQEIFGVPRETYDDIIDGIRNWYNALDNNQKDINASWQDNNSKPLIKHLINPSDLREIFLVKIPDSPGYGFGKVESWVTDKTREYAKKVREGKQLIDQNRVKVPSPEYQLVGDGEDQAGTVRFRGDMSLVLTHADPQAQVYVTDNSKDPISSSERAIFQTRKEIDIASIVRARGTNVTVKFVAKDAAGNWGIVKTLLFIDATQQYRISTGNAMPTIVRESGMTVNFVFPTDGKAFETTIKSLITEALRNKVINTQQVKEIVQRVLDSLNSGAK